MPAIMAEEEDYWEMLQNKLPSPCSIKGSEIGCEMQRYTRAILHVTRWDTRPAAISEEDEDV
jgi:hypothetical protein